MNWRKIETKDLQNKMTKNIIEIQDDVEILNDSFAGITLPKYGIVISEVKDELVIVWGSNSILYRLPKVFLKKVVKARWVFG